jgi:hypothetical protein
MDISEFSRVEARGGIYGKEWEVCEGSRGILKCIVKWWIAERREPDGGEPTTTEYRFVPGRELSGDEYSLWLRTEDALGHHLTADEFLPTLEA